MAPPRKSNRLRVRKVSPCKKKNTDYLNELPGDLMTTISSMLDIRDAVKISVLSKRWRYVWITNTDLKFNHVNILGFNYNQLKENWAGGDSVFVRLVDQIMKQRCKGIEKMNSFSIRFELGNCFSQYINRWISCAVKKGVDTIDLDFTRFRFNTHPYSHRQRRFVRYNFSLIRTVSQNKGSLKHVRVVFCNFRGRTCSKKFNSLVSLHFQDVSINNFQLTRVLEECPLLEKLSLHSCRNITYLTIGECNVNNMKSLSLKDMTLSEIEFCAKSLTCLKLESVHLSGIQFANYIENCHLLEELYLHNCHRIDFLRICDGTNTHLKVLSLKDCYYFGAIDVCVNNLHTLECFGRTRMLPFKIAAPRLVNVIIFEDIITGYPITNMCLDIFEKIENLILRLDLSLEFFKIQGERFPPLYNTQFSNMKRLVLVGFPAVKEDELPMVKRIFNCFPNLQILELNMEGPFVLPDIDWKKNDKTKMVKRCTNGTVRRLELNGFLGNQDQIDLLKYLLGNLKGLKVLAIGPSYKVYESFNVWVYSEAKVWGKRWFESESEWIRSIVPSFIRIEFQ